MVLVNSSNLRDVDYNPITETLTIQFRSGSVYAYYYVPPHVYEGLMAASSKGKYLHRHIKNSYTYRRLQ